MTTETVMPPERTDEAQERVAVRRPVVALGYQASDGTIVVTDVLCMNFPDMTNEEMADLSWKLSQWSDQVRQRRYAQ